MGADENLHVTFSLEAAHEGTRIDRVLSLLLECSRSYVQKLIADGRVSVDGHPLTTKSAPARGGQVDVLLPPPEVLTVRPQAIPLDIVYEDDELLVVDKPRGMVVHPAPGNEDGTLVNALLYHCQGRLSTINGVLRPGIVHRIDKDTSGLLMVAKTDQAHASLSAQLSAHTIVRRYTALVMGNLTEEAGTVDAPIGRDPKNRLRMAVVSQGGRQAVTHWRVLKRFGAYTLLEARLETGRTHQIRVHMAHIRHPLVGDLVYGPQRQALFSEGQLLHAGTLGFVHPVSGTYMEFHSPVPPVFAAVLRKLGGTAAP